VALAVSRGRPIRSARRNRAVALAKSHPSVNPLPLDGTESPAATCTPGGSAGASRELPPEYDRMSTCLWEAHEMPLRDLHVEGLTLQVDPTASRGDWLVLSWRGRADLRNPSSVLGGYFQGIMSTASASQQSIEFDFQRLEYLCSSTIVALMQFIQNVRRKGMRLRLVFDRSVSWQNGPFDLLRRLDAGDGLFEVRSA
jgi:hypothetical protein